MQKLIQKKIIKQIERLCEKQYRKGFQQGYYACKNKELSEKQVNDFRYEGMSQNYSKMTHPHTGRKQVALERLMNEIDMPDMNELRHLLNGQ